MSEQDYLANHVVEEGDKLDYGVRGMKWGVRRSSSQLQTAAAQRSSSPATKSGSDAPDHLSKSSGGSESSAARYARLAAEAKSGKGKQMSDEDLKFFNARTEALKKVEKLNESNPGWLKSTSKKVIQSAAEKQMQTLADGLANKFISERLLSEINKKAPETIEEAIRKGAADRARKEAIERGIQRALGTKSSS